MPPHRDTKRKTTLQIVVSCSTTEFSFWPQTHHYRSELPLDEKGYISKAGVAQLRKAGYEEVRFCAKPGDSLTFLGGELIHGSPEVPATCLEPRVCVYPEFWPHASSVAIAGMKKRKGCPCSCSCTFERKKPCWRTWAAGNRDNGVIPCSMQLATSEERNAAFARVTMRNATVPFRT